jgi:hypothetical protein
MGKILNTILAYIAGWMAWWLWGVVVCYGFYVFGIDVPLVHYQVGFIGYLLGGLNVYGNISGRMLMIGVGMLPDNLFKKENRFDNPDAKSASSWVLTLIQVASILIMWLGLWVFSLILL